MHGGVVCEVVDGAAHVLRRALGRQRLHQVASFVHLVVTRQFATVDVGRERDESAVCKSVGYACDLGV